MHVRTRFAPSPTGYLHIGGVRTALYAYLFAKKNKGDFILRIEDTDMERFVEGATEVIYDTMKSTGLYWDEGPDIGGKYGPYVQSERKDIYAKYAKELVDKGHAYYCFCTKERLDTLRNECEEKGETFKYDKKCLSLSKEEIEENLKNGVPYVIRQKVPEEGQIGFDDMVFGTITVDCNTLDDGVLLKSDGMPTYNFANVVDDHLMEISHVIRGSEYLSSAPKYNLLYKGFDWEIPKYIHLPPVMKNQTQKLSKRHGDASYEDLAKKGYLKDAILNYIALLGWSPGNNMEKFTLKEMVEMFSVEGINKSPAIFDIEKLTWLNAQYIREMSPEEFTEYAKPYYYQVLPEGKYDLSILARILQPRVEVFTTIPEQVAFLEKLDDYSLDLFYHKKMKTDSKMSVPIIDEAIEVIKGIEDYTEQNVHNALFELVGKLGMKNGQVLWPIRVAVSGEAVSPGGAVEIAALLGKEETLNRLYIAKEKLKNQD